MHAYMCLVPVGNFWIKLAHVRRFSHTPCMHAWVWESVTGPMLPNSIPPDCESAYSGLSNRLFFIIHSVKIGARYDPTRFPPYLWRVGQMCHLVSRIFPRRRNSARDGLVSLSELEKCIQTIFLFISFPSNSLRRWRAAGLGGIQCIQQISIIISKVSFPSKACGADAPLA